MPPVAPLAQQQPGDDESGDDEEDVHPDEAAGEARQTGVVEHDQQDGDGPQPFDVRPEPPVARCSAGLVGGAEFQPPGRCLSQRAHASRPPAR